MDVQDNLPNFRDIMGFDAGNEVMYEDDATDNSIPDVQKITKKNNILPLWGNTTTMNLNTLVLENIVQSTYYKNYLNEVTTFQQVAEEVYYNVGHLEPWERGTRKTQGMTGMCGGVRGVGAGGVISTAFCLLYKMFTLKITRKQLVSMINSSQSVYLRGLGFMYIRYTQPPSDLWLWMEPYLVDEEEIDPRSGGGDKMTINQLVRMMLTKLDFYGTLFPRIPVPIQKDIELKFRERARQMMEDDPRYGRSRSRDRLRSRSRDRLRSRSRDRLRSRSRDRLRSRSRDRLRSRSRDRLRSRSRDRLKSRSRDRRSRSKDRNRSKSKDRIRSRSPRDFRRRTRSKSRDRNSRSTQRRDRERDEKKDNLSKNSSLKHSSDKDRKRIQNTRYKCKHHLRHHHCRKHRTSCPSKAKTNGSKLEDSKSKDLNIEDLKLESSKLNDFKLNDSNLDNLKTDEPTVKDQKLENLKLEDSKLENLNLENSKVENLKFEENEKIDENNILT